MRLIIVTVMMLAAMTFWRKMPITVTLLLLATVYFVTAKDTVIGSQEKDHWNYGHVDETEKKFSPRFKHPSKMYLIDLKTVGSSIRLRCAAEGNPTPNITWYKNKRTPIERTYLQPIYNKWSMTLEELTKSDTGNYTCIVCNELDCIEHTLMLQVQERFYARPLLTQGVVNQTHVVGETARFHCDLFSDMHPYVYWMFFKKEEHFYSDILNPKDSTAQETIVNFGGTNRIVVSENRLDKPEYLTLYKVAKEDEGWYVCVALNTLGNTTAKGYLTVIESTPTNITGTKKKDQENIEITITKILKEMFDEFSKKQETHFQAIRHDIEVMSAKYNEFYSKMEQERLEDKKTIKHLDGNIEELESKNRSDGIGNILKV